MGTEPDVISRSDAAAAAALSCLAARRLRPLAAILTAVVLFGAGVAAQQEPEQPPGINLKIEGEYVSISVNENTGTSLKDFVKLAQQISHRVITFLDTDLNVPNANVTWVGTVRIKREEFFSFFQTMLYIKGFACVMRGTADSEIVQIVNMAGQQRNEITSAARYVPEEELESYSSQTGVQILTTVLLKHINAQAAAQATRPFFAQASSQIGGVLTGNLGDNRSVMLQGFGPQVYSAYQVLRLADVPPILPEYETRVVRLENATAEELEPILKQVLEDRSRRIQQGQAGAGAPVAPGQGGDVQVIAHGSLNALLVSGPPDRIVEALDLIAQLDRPIEASSSDIHVIQLKNVLADDLQNTLRNFLREDLQAERQQQAGQAATGARQPRQTVIVAHPESNSILVSATQSNFKQIERMIGELDERQPQVLIEAALVELRTTDMERLGVELGLLDIGQGDYTRPFGLTSFGLSQYQDTNGDGLPDSRLPDLTNPLQGFTGGIISSGDFAIPVLINALQSDERANILSLPSVVVNNNASALVKSEENRPTQQVSQGTATTSTGLGPDRKAGIELNISPSISTNDYLRLNIDLTVSRFLTAVDPTTGGPTLSRQVQTQVTLPSGATMVLGGIIEDAESNADSGVPLLKDVPLIGWLFRNKNTDREKTNLYFFITPTILDEDDFSDLQEISQRKKLEASQYIGHRRIKLVDPRWQGSPATTLEDSGSSVDDLDRFGGFEVPLYRRPDTPPKLDGSMPTGPDMGQLPNEPPPTPPTEPAQPPQTEPTPEQPAPSPPTPDQPPPDQPKPDQPKDDSGH